MSEQAQEKKRKEIMGVQQGEHLASKELKLQAIQLDKDKGRRQGFDAVYRNPKTGNLVVVDFKGGPYAKLSTNQKRATYMNTVADQTLASKKATPKEREAAKMIKADLAKGKRVEFLGIKTPSLGKTHISHHSFAVKPANSQSVDRIRLNHNKVSNFNGSSISGWQQKPSPKITRAANDNSRTPPKPSPPPQQTPKRSR